MRAKLLFAFVLLSGVLLFFFRGAFWGGAEQVLAKPVIEEDEGGIGGSGLTIGPINGFGSIIVNGIRFDVDQASLIRDQMEVRGEEHFAAGEVVSVTGVVDPETHTGIAQKVVFEALTRGPVSKTAISEAGAFEVAGQPVLVNDLTTIQGAHSALHMKLGEIVEVSGYLDKDEVIRATSLKVIPAESEVALVRNGDIHDLDVQAKTFNFNNVGVDFSGAEIHFPAEEMRENMFVKVTINEIRDDTLYVSDIHRIRPLTFPPDIPVELDGIVTRLLPSEKSLELNHFIKVKTTSDTIMENLNGSDLSLDASIEVAGHVDADGVLVADHIELEEREDLPKLEAFVDSIDYENQSIVIFGKTVKITPSTIFFDESKQGERKLTLEKIRVGEYVDSKVGILGNGDLVAKSLHREDVEPDLSFQGMPQDIDLENGTFTLFGITMVIQPYTRFLDAMDLPINDPEIALDWIRSKKVVEAEGIKVDANTVHLTELIINYMPVTVGQ